MKYPLSIIILTNRDDDIFLQSLQTAQIANEVVIVDNNSGADFEELSNNYNFIKHDILEPINDFANIRNQAIELAKQDWIFFLDSDEVFTPEEFDSKIWPIIQDNQVQNIKIKRHDHYLNQKVKYGDVSDFHQIRIFKKNSGNFVNAVHEVFVPNDNSLTHSSEFTLHHKPHHNLAEFFKKIIKYSEIRASEMSEKFYTPKYKILLQMFLYPPSKFIYMYFIKFGFLDGFAGFIYSLMMSLHSFFVRVYLYEKLK